MYVLVRLLLVWLRSRSAPRQLPTDLIVTPLRALPNDLDLNRHVNNGRYLTLMDLGRYDFIFKTGLLPLVKKNGWYPVVSTAAIRFRKSLVAWQRFELTTQIIWWDEKWFFIEQVFRVGNHVFARALVKGLFRDQNGNVSVQRLLEAVGEPARDPGPPPPLVSGWLAAEAGFL